MTRRPGLSLTEVLVALFIMGIGTIAVLTLFPLGALNMAQALRDDRTTQAAAQAEAYLRYYVQDKRDQNRLTSEPFHLALTDPGSTVSAYLVKIDGPNANQASYPVVIDPMGYRARGGTDNNPTASSRIVWVADNGFGDGSAGSPHTSALPRRSMKLITDRNTTAAEVALQLPLATRTCTLLDGFGYDPTTGQPATVAGANTIDRDLRYNWFWVIQKLNNSKAAATVTVVVFDKRAPGYAPAGMETVYAPSGAQVGLTQVSFTNAATTPAVPPMQRGGWLLDATVALLDEKTRTKVYVPTTGPVPEPLVPWVRNAHFYRVTSVTETASGIDVELDVPLREDTGRNPAADPQLQPQHRRFIYLSGVAEVFVRPDLDL